MPKADEKLIKKIKRERINDATEKRHGNFSIARKIELPGMRL